MGQERERTERGERKGGGKEESKTLPCLCGACLIEVITGDGEWKMFIIINCRAESARRAGRLFISLSCFPGSKAVTRLGRAVRCPLQSPSYRYVWMRPRLLFNCRLLALPSDHLDFPSFCFVWLEPGGSFPLAECILARENDKHKLNRLSMSINGFFLKKYMYSISGLGFGGQPRRERKPNNLQYPPFSGHF